jgi:predicted ferric reductase
MLTMNTPSEDKRAPVPSARPAQPARPGTARPKAAQPKPASAPAKLLTGLDNGLRAVGPRFVQVVTVLAILAALEFAVATHPTWLAGLETSLTESVPKVYWYLSRSTALVGLTLLWGSMVLGLAISNKMARAWQGGPTFAALHEYTGLLGLAFGTFHGLILLADPYIHYTLDQVLIPFASVNYRPLWVGLGQIALYLLIPATLTFYLRRWISYRAWRMIHYLNFVVFALVIVHGIMSGTDTAGVWVSGLYWVSALSVIALTVYRASVVVWGEPA